MEYSSSTQSSEASRSVNYIESLCLWLRIHSVVSFAILILYIAMGAALGYSIGIAIGSLLGQLYTAKTYGLSIDIEKSVENLLRSIATNLTLSHTLGDVFQCVWILILVPITLNISRLTKCRTHRIASLSTLLLSLVGIALSIVSGFFMQSVLVSSLKEVKDILVKIFDKYISNKISLTSSMINEVSANIMSSTAKALSGVWIYNTVLKCIVSAVLIITSLSLLALRNSLFPKLSKLSYLSIALILFAIVELLTGIPSINTLLGVVTAVLSIAIGILDWTTASEIKKYTAQTET